MQSGLKSLSGKRVWDKCAVGTAKQYAKAGPDNNKGTITFLAEHYFFNGFLWLIMLCFCCTCFVCLHCLAEYSFKLKV